MQRSYRIDTQHMQHVTYVAPCPAASDVQFPAAAVPRASAVARLAPPCLVYSSNACVVCREQRSLWIVQRATALAADSPPAAFPHGPAGAAQRVLVQLVCCAA